MVADYIVCTLITRQLRPPPLCLSVTTNHYFSLFARRGTSARPCPRAHVWCLASGRFLFLPRPDGPETTSGVVRQRQSAGTWHRISTWQLASRTHYCAALLPTPLIQLNTCFDRRLRGVCRLSLAEVTTHINELRFNCFISLVDGLLWWNVVDYSATVEFPYLIENSGLD